MPVAARGQCAAQRTVGVGAHTMAGRLRAHNRYKLICVACVCVHTRGDDGCDADGGDASRRAARVLATHFARVDRGEVSLEPLPWHRVSAAQSVG
jgi:hypothetical protein